MGLKCKECEQEFNSTHGLSAHMKKHVREKRKKGLKLYPCYLRISQFCEVESVNRFNCPACLQKFFSGDYPEATAELVVMGHNMIGRW
jgi:hypothetical protein